jgi:hypothetical protein
VKVGVLVTGDSAVRAAHSLAAHSVADEVVVIGPARSRDYRVIDDASGCDLIIGTGPEAPARARDLGIPLVWDGAAPEEGVAVWGASPVGLARAVASRETTPTLTAVAHPDLEERSEQRMRFPSPVGRIQVGDIELGGMTISVGKSTVPFASLIVESPARVVTITEEGPFMAGIALAAGVAIATGAQSPVWDDALAYLEVAAEMGLVMAESTPAGV